MKQTLIYHFERSIPTAGLLSYQKRIFIRDTRRPHDPVFVGAWFGRFPEKGELRQALKREWRATLRNIEAFEARLISSSTI